jgi:hypothetical protein
LRFELWIALNILQGLPVVYSRDFQSYTPGTSGAPSRPAAQGCLHGRTVAEAGCLHGRTVAQAGKVESGSGQHAPRASSDDRRHGDNDPGEDEAAPYRLPAASRRGRPPNWSRTFSSLRTRQCWPRGEVLADVQRGECLLRRIVGGVYGLHVQLAPTPAPEDPGDPGGQEILRAGVLDLDEKLEIEDDTRSTRGQGRVRGQGQLLADSALPAHKTKFKRSGAERERESARRQHLPDVFSLHAPFDNNYA